VSPVHPPRLIIGIRDTTNEKINKNNRFALLKELLIFKMTLRTIITENKINITRAKGSGNKNALIVYINKLFNIKERLKLRWHCSPYPPMNFPSTRYRNGIYRITNAKYKKGRYKMDLKNPSPTLFIPTWA
jgi:hypothetical protein